MAELLKYPNQPSRIGKMELDEILVWAVKNGASDIVLKTGSPVMVKIHGRRARITNRDLTSPEVQEVINEIYGNNGSSMISSGRDVDTAYSIKVSRGEKYRYRFNGTGILSDGHNAFSVTLRSIPGLPPTIEELGVPMFIVEAMSKSQGMCLITGETGSGKSTLQAAVLRHRIEQADANLNVLTFESPVEFLFDDVVKPSSEVQQSEIPRNLPSFDMAIRNAMRRDPDIILIGESRDAITMGASIDAARSGHLLMSTMHTNGVASTFRRAVGMFPEGERNARALDVIETVNVIVTQRLLRTLDGKRAPIREILVFDSQIRNELLECPMDRIPAVARDLTERYGQTMESDARRLLDEGVISQDEFKLVAAGEKMRTEDSKVEFAGVTHSPAFALTPEDMKGLD